MKALRLQIERIAPAEAKVLITGESGVGKDLVARALHLQSRRAQGPFEPVNCAGLPETLLESELFGFAKGSFTGAYHDKPGKLECAHDGTLFLDEVGEMSLRMQTLLLRFLETGEIEKVGGTGQRRVVDVRLISATHRNFADLIERGAFREDLYYRLNVVHIYIPPLRERPEDIEELAGVFLHRFADRNHSRATAFSAAAMTALAKYSWPGNVRQLENVVERAVVTAEHSTIDLADLPEEMRGSRSIVPKRERRRSPVEDLYERMVQRHESFWTVVYPLFMNRELTRTQVRQLVARGLEESRGSYRVLLTLFNVEPEEYKRFLNFLRQHGCQVPFKAYRTAAACE